MGRFHLTWELVCRLSKRESVELTHRGEAMHTEPNGTSTDRPGVEWRILLNSFPTLPASRVIRMVVHDGLGPDDVLSGPLRIALHPAKLHLYVMPLWRYLATAHRLYFLAPGTHYLPSAIDSLRSKSSCRPRSCAECCSSS
jgi:hypothetical protein